METKRVLVCVSERVRDKERMRDGESYRDNSNIMGESSSSSPIRISAS